MPVTCPACNKTGQADAACQRCGCDLSRLHATMEASALNLQSATTLLASGRWAEALAQAERSWRLRHAATSARVAFLAASAGGKTLRALRWRERALSEARRQDR